MLITLNNLNRQAIFYILFLWHFYWCHVGFVLVSWITNIPFTTSKIKGDFGVRGCFKDLFIYLFIFPISQSKTPDMKVLFKCEHKLYRQRICLLCDSTYFVLLWEDGPYFCSPPRLVCVYFAIILAQTLRTAYFKHIFTFRPDIHSRPPGFGFTTYAKVATKPEGKVPLQRVSKKAFGFTTVVSTTVKMLGVCSAVYRIWSSGLPPE